MKSYTDIEQSKVLAEILPLDSADMVYVTTGYAMRVLPKEDVDAKTYLKVSPCWSLAALLSVLPYPSLHKTFSGWRCDSYNKEGTSCTLGESSDNPVDACVEIIVLLNELKML